MGLVDHQRSPIYAAQKGGVCGDQIVTGQQHVELKLGVLGRHLLGIYLLEAQLVSPDYSSRGLWAHIGDTIDVWSPQLQFALPVDQSGKRHGYEEQGVQECHRLDRLAQAYLIGQDGEDALAPTVAEPVDTLQLEWMQIRSSSLQEFRLILVFLLHISGGLVLTPILMAGSQILVEVDGQL